MSQIQNREVPKQPVHLKSLDGRFKDSKVMRPNVKKGVVSNLNSLRKLENSLKQQIQAAIDKRTDALKVMTPIQAQMVQTGLAKTKSLTFWDIRIKDLNGRLERVSNDVIVMEKVLKVNA